MIVLGIESSCDETSASIVSCDKRIYSHFTHSHAKKHSVFGGVVPELAARHHMEFIQSVIERAILDSNIDIKEIDAIGVTAGPGLIGSLIVGVMAAKGLALRLNKPCLAINHLEGHALTPRLVYHDLEFPYILLLISGGHCELLLVENLGQYVLLGKTKDDSPGEAFDKVAKFLNLDYPGGPSIEKRAHKGNPNAIFFPRPLCNQNECDFSFSGLKTSVKNYIANLPSINENIIDDICSSFQHTVSLILSNKLENAIEKVAKITTNNQDFIVKNIVVSGGVASNQYIRNALTQVAQTKQKEIFFPPIHLCTDNAAMIAWVAIERLKIGKYINDLSFAPRSSWPLY